VSEVRALIEQLVEKGLDPIDAAEVVTRAAILGASAQPRSAGAIRQERYRRNKPSQSVTSDGVEHPSPDKEIPPTPPKEINPNPVPPSPPKGGSSPAAFSAQWNREFEETFWPAYPHRVGKADARGKFAVARRKAPLETIMAGLGRYASKTDDRPWCNPATWLHQERWTDEVATPIARAGPEPKRNPALEAANRLMEQLDAVTPSETPANPAYPRLVALSGNG
jgi:hypothetical protein